MIQLAAIVSDTDHDIEVAKVLEYLPGFLAAGRGTLVEGRILQAFVKMPLPRVIRVVWNRQRLVRGCAVVEIVFRGFDRRFEWVRNAPVAVWRQF